MFFLLPFFLLLIFSNSVSINIIDKRVQTKMQDAQNEDKTSIIVLSNDLENKKFLEKLNGLNAKIKYKLDIIKAYAIELPCKCIEKIARLPEVDFIADDAGVSTLMDIARGTVGGRKADQYQLTGKKIGVAVLDTGVYPHTDLSSGQNRIIAFKDFVNKKIFPYDDNGHGSHVAGIVAGNGHMSNGKYKGIATEANIIAIKVMDKDGAGSTSDIVAGMQWVLQNKNKYNIKVASLSIGSDPDLKESEDPLVKGVVALWKAGIVVVSAAGNAGPKQKTIKSPGISPTIITVGASDDKRTIDTRDDSIAKFSSRGPTKEKKEKPDIVAPGVAINSINTDREFLPESNIRKYKLKNLEKPYKEMSGTSMATPVVSGVIALLIEKEPYITPDEIKTRIMDSAIPLSNNRNAQGSGQINIERLLKD